ncbi:MAG: hypothetical protein KA054_03035 [Candidatus Moranbacteria bacterium]|nr:hypothetical protein [Candidatus Moranbacteria bacterium]
MDDERIQLAYYGGAIQTLLAQILCKRRQSGLDIKNGYESIPPRDYFSHLAHCPLPEVDGTRSEEANRIIRFLNHTDDILNLKRGMRALLKLSGNHTCSLFSGEQYDPKLLDMEAKEGDEE